MIILILYLRRWKQREGHQCSEGHMAGSRGWTHQLNLWERVLSLCSRKRSVFSLHLEPEPCNPIPESDTNHCTLLPPLSCVLRLGLVGRIQEISM